MTQISDQKLNEFISGDLPEAEAQEVEAMLNSDPALCARVAAMSSGNTTELANTVKTAVENIVKDEVPAEILDMLRPQETLIPLRGNKNTSAGIRKFFQPTAIAASLAVVVAGGVLFLQPSATNVSLPEHTVTALNTIIDGAQSGATIVGESYLNTDGQFCRSFKLDGSVKQVGVACKSDADWQVIALVTVPAEAVYSPAGVGADDPLNQYTRSMRPLEDGGEIRFLAKQH